MRLQIKINKILLLLFGLTKKTNSDISNIPSDRNPDICRGSDISRPFHISRLNISTKGQFQTGRGGISAF